MKNRERNLDLLRVIACFMVIVIHVASDYINDYVNIPNLKFTISNIFDSFSRVAVPIFVLLSGGFILSEDKNKKIIPFYEKFFCKIFIPTILWSICYVIYSYLKGFTFFYYFNKSFDLLKPLKDWFLGGPFYHMWYLYMIFGLYFLTPFLISMKDRIGEKNFFRLGILFLILSIYLDKYFCLFWLIQSFSYLGYFMLGHSLKYFYKEKLNYKFLFFIYILLVGLIFIFTELLIREKFFINVSKLYFYNYLTPVVILASLIFYLLFLNLKVSLKYNLESLSDKTFYIYLIHAGVLDIFIFIIRDIYRYEPNPLWYIPSMSIFIFYISYLISKIKFF